jgi:chromosome segregation ATPase
MVVAEKRSSQLVQGQGTRDLWLRVVGSRRDGQIIRLTAPKCTIGSADGCTLRLRAAGVRAVQCLVLRGARGTVARSCHASTRLNGRAFSDAAVVAGDRLQIGPITLEVVDPPSRAQPPDAATVEPSPSPGEQSSRDVARVGRERTRKFIHAVRTMRSELATFQRQSEQEHEERAAAHARELQQWADERDRCTADWHEERQQLNASSAAEITAHAERQAELEALETQLAGEREAFDSRRAQIEAEHAAAHEALGEQHAALAAAQDALRQLRESHEQERAEQCSQLDRQRAELAHSSNEFAELRQRLAEERSEWERQRSELEQTHNQTQGDVEQRYAQLESDRQAWQQVQQEHESRMQRECAALESAREELRQQHGQHNAARAELDQRAGELADRQTECDARHEEHLRREQELNERTAGLDQRAAELGETQTQLDGHRAELQATQRGLEEARNELARAREALDRTRADIDRGRDELAAGQAELAQARAQFEAEQAELHSARTALAESQAEISGGFDQLLIGHEALEAARQQFAEEQHGRRTQQEAAEAAVDAAREQAEVDLQSLHADRATWAAELLAWETSRSVLEEQLAERGTQLAAREEELAGLAEQLHALGERVAEVRSREDALQAQHDQFVRQREQDQAELVERAETLERMAGEIEQQRQRMQAEQAVPPDSAERNDEHAAQLAELPQQLTAAQQQLAAQQQQLDESQRRCDAQATELEHLQSELEQQRADFDLERAHWDELRQSLMSSNAPEASAESSAGEPHEPADWAEDAERSGVGEEDTVKITNAASYDVEECDSAEEAVVDVDVVPDVQFDDETDFADMPTQEFDALRRSGVADEDKTIEECFAELLNRYRGQGGNVPAEPRGTAPRVRRKSDSATNKTPAPAERELVEPPAAAMPMNVVDVATEPVEIQRRTSGAVPNYGAMREVARSHAKLAIDTHGQKRLVRAALITSSAALATMLATIVVVAVLPGQHTALRTLANVGWVGAIFWVFVASKAWQQLAAAKHADETGLQQNIEQAGRQHPQ